MAISSGVFINRQQRRDLLLGLVALFLASLLAPPLRAQNYLGQAGSPTFTTALPVELGFLDAANGNLHLGVPLGTFPQRGSVPFSAGLVYDSSIWVEAGTVPPSWQPTNIPNSWGGWRFASTGSSGSVSFGSNTIVCDIPPPPYLSYNTYFYFQWIAPDGTPHVFNIFTERDPNNCDQGNTPTADGFATDSSGYHMFVTNYTTATVFAPDGTQVYPSVKDTNGNFFSSDANGNVIDTLGRKPVVTTTNCNGNSHQICYDILNSQGTTSRTTVTTASISVHTNFGQSGVTEYSGSITVVQSVQLPDGTSYQFGYDSGTSAGHFGQLISITLPTTGQITYGYTTFQDAFGNKGSWVSSRTSGGGNWAYTPSVMTTCPPGVVGCLQKVTVTKPSTDTTVYTFTLNNGAWKSTVSSFTGSSTLLSSVSNTWDFSQPCSPTPCSGASKIRILTTATTLPTPGGNSITSQTKTTYNDVFTMNVASIKAWKFYAGTSPTFPTTPDRETDITYHATFGNNITNRVSQTTVKDSGGNVVAQTNSTYDDSGTLFNSTPATGIFQHDDANYGLSNTIRGNLTTVKRCTVFTACSSNSVQTSMTYDTTGHVLSVKDPNTNITTFSYTDSFFKDVGDGPSNPPQPFSAPAPTSAFLTAVTPPMIPASTLGYYYHTGQPASSKDANGNTSYSHFFDSYFSRPTSTVLPNGGWSYSTYAASETLADSYIGITAAFSTSAGAGIRQDEAALDNLGRPITKKLISDPEGITTVTTNYDTTGRVLNVSHPARSTSSTTDGTETPTYDGLGRATKLTHQDTSSSQTLFGAAVTGAGTNASQLCTPTTTYGLGFPTLYIDEATKRREVWTDGFGRTIEADEPDSSGNLTSYTCYSYDALGNLLQIVHGTQTRTYAYDTLSRVKSVTIPELSNCAVTYTYDSNSNLQTRVAPAPNQPSCTTTVTTTYSHDALNRLTKITYGATTPVATPTVRYGYDGTALTGCGTTPPTLADSNPKGRMTSMCDGSGAATWAHDAAGRIITEKRIILGSSAITQTISYSYNLDGSIATLTYPSGKTVTYTVSNAQRLTAAKDVANNIQFATAASYVPPGALSGVITGQISGGFGGITESHTYNSSLEYTSTQASSSAGTALNLTLNYNLTGGDNGTVTTITNNVSTETGRTQTLTYDPLNRIASATTQATSGVDCWGQNFIPDAVANLNTISSAQCSSNSLSVTVDPNNHINSSTTFAYDAAGNMTQDGKTAGYAYSFDAENRLAQATGMTGSPYCYVYDGNGLRVAKKSGANSDCTGGTVTKLYWRSIAGDALAETDGTGSTTNSAYNEYVFFAGRRIASRDGSGHIFYWFADQLGSTRTITTGSGTGQTPGQLCYDADFTPYGQEIAYTTRLQTTACPPSYKFTGYERDPETAYGAGDTGIDYAFARYYSSRLGRFLSTDPLGGSIGNLQSHNAYAYTHNNPLNSVDPSGMTDCPQGKTCWDIWDFGFWNGRSPLGLGGSVFDILLLAFTPTDFLLNTDTSPGCLYYFDDNACAPDTWSPVYGNWGMLSLLGGPNSGKSRLFLKAESDCAGGAGREIAYALMSMDANGNVTPGPEGYTVTEHLLPRVPGGMKLLTGETTHSQPNSSFNDSLGGASKNDILQTFTVSPPSGDGNVGVFIRDINGSDYGTNGIFWNYGPVFVNGKSAPHACQ
jgi:RHS repeat-associated protein